MRPIRVIHVSLGLHLGGMEKLLVEFAKHADRTRFDLRFVSLTTRGEAADDIERAGWPVTTLNESAGIRMKLPLRLRSLFRDIGADIVHTHNTRPLLYAAPAARLAGAGAVVHTRHGQRLGASRRQTMLFNLACRWADRVVSVSADSTKLACSQGLPREKLLTIHNGIDLAPFTFRVPDANGSIVFVGRLSPEKDLDTLLEAVALLRQRGSSTPLHIAGDGPERSRLERLCAERQLHDSVRFLGAVRNVPGLLATAGLLVLPSLSEGISLALLEAMASGVPVVATRIGGNAEVIEDERTGLLIPTRDPEALAGAIHRLQADPSAATRLAVAARQRVETCFDVREMVRRYESLYESILESRRSHGKAA
jgi:glycosyltransferase involved in cell wall biosynthesis